MAYGKSTVNFFTTPSPPGVSLLPVWTCSDNSKTPFDDLLSKKGAQSEKSKHSNSRRNCTLSSSKSSTLSSKTTIMPSHFVRSLPLNQVVNIRGNLGYRF